MILEQTVNLLLQQHGEVIAPLRLTSVVVGQVFTAVRLNNHSVGMAGTGASVCKLWSRESGIFQPGNWQGLPLLSVIQNNDTSGFCPSIRLAAINAVSSWIIQSGNYRIVENADPFDLAVTNVQSRICLVGAFRSYMQKSKEQGFSLKVLELNPEMFEPDDRYLYVEAGRYAEVFAESDIIIITGSSIANYTIDDLLQAVPSGAQVILSGPTAGLLPDLLFEAGVNIIGATRVTDPDMAIRVIAEGGAGYHLFNNRSAQKICILRQ